MQRFIYLALILIMLLGQSCALKRSNPLDPEGNSGVTAPPKVSGLKATGSGPGIQSKYVSLKWSNTFNMTRGYFIYMGLAYDSAYKRIGIVGSSATDTLITTRVSNNITPGYYYFKVSAYKVYNLADTLEGSLSEWADAHVD